jgi:cytochrome P450 family 142 subfamily A polypeptide 1
LPAVTQTEQRRVNLLDGDFYAGDPWPVYRWLRDEHPVYRDDVNGIWGVSRYDDVVEIEKHPARYSSARGSRPRLDPQQSMIDSDDPVHQSRRRMVARRFTPRAVKQDEDDVRAVATRLIDRVAPRGECDVVRDLAAPFPAAVIGRKLGFPPELWDKCREWSELTMHDGGQYPGDGAPPETTTRTVDAVLEFAVETMALAQARREDPRDDLVSVWANEELDWPDGTRRRMTDDELVSEALLLLDGGAETTRSVIGTACVALSEHPDQHAILRDDPSILATTGVEEFIRYVSPLLNMARTATEDHELRGVEIAAGDELLLMYASANRDERVFDDPDRFDVTRHHNLHVAFGFGTHFCLGASLARLEIRVMFEELLRRLPDMRLAPGATPRIVPAAFSRAYDAVPVVFTPTG